MVWIGMPKILILDDDTTFLNAVTAALMAERTDIAIDTALCAEAGLLLIGTIHYDAIISDYRMSGLDGLRLVKECRRLRPDTPIVLITGYGDREMQREALHSGAYAFLHKPVHADVLLSVVDRALHRTNRPLPCAHPQDRDTRSGSLDAGRSRRLETVQEIDRSTQQQLQSPGNDTVH
jgi:two-component system nitrogen regulation response regulator NtrX